MSDNNYNSYDGDDDDQRRQKWGVGGGRSQNKIQTCFFSSSNSIPVIYKCRLNDMIFLEFFSISFCKLNFCRPMRLLENDKFPNLQSCKKYASLKAFISGPAKRRESGARAPPPSRFKKNYIKEKKRMNDLPVSPVRYQNMLIWLWLNA